MMVHLKTHPARVYTKNPYLTCTACYKLYSYQLIKRVVKSAIETKLTIFRIKIVDRSYFYVFKKEVFFDKL